MNECARHMKHSKPKDRKKLILFITILITFSLLLTNVVTIFGAEGDASGGEDANNNVILPTDSQYLELRAVKIEDVGEGENVTKKLTMELWGHDLKFTGFDVRFSFDNKKLKLSNIVTNELSTNPAECYKWESEFNRILRCTNSN